MKILIVGLPKSGTTGLFYKIRNSLAGNVSAHFECHRAPEVSPPEPDHILAKVLYRKDAGFLASYEAYDRKIVIHRDPRDRLVSAVLYMSGYQCAYADEEEKIQQMVHVLQRKETGEEVSLLSILNLHRELSGLPALDAANSDPGQAGLNLAMVSDLKTCQAFSYDDLIDGKVEGLEDYLGFPLSGTSDVDPTHQRVVRTRKSGSWRAWFTQEDVQFFKAGFDPIITQLGWDPSWELADSEPIPAEHASGYFLRLIGERQAEHARMQKLKDSPAWESDKEKTIAKLMGPDWKKK